MPRSCSQLQPSKETAGKTSQDCTAQMSCPLIGAGCARVGLGSRLPLNQGAPLCIPLPWQRFALRHRAPGATLSLKIIMSRTNRTHASALTNHRTSHHPHHRMSNMLDGRDVSRGAHPADQLAMRAFSL